MQFSYGEVDSRDLAKGLAQACIGLFVVVPSSAILIAETYHHLFRFYSTVSTILITLVLLYVATRVYLLRRGGEFRTRPATVLALAIVSAASSASAQVSLGSKDLVYSVIFTISSLFIGLVGDLSMLVIGWLATDALIIWVDYSVGYRSWDLFWAVTIIAVTDGCIEGMAANAVTALTSLTGLRSEIDALAETIVAANSIDVGLENCLPLVKETLRAESVCAFVRDFSGAAFTLRRAWPDDGDRFLGLVESQDFRRATSTGSTVANKDYVIIPVGYTVVGELILIGDLRSPGKKSQARITEAAEGIANCFVRLASRSELDNALVNESRTDPLTGLANRRKLGERIDIEIERASPSGQGLCVAMIDIDNFKSFNDLYGHLTGDEVLKKLASRLASRVRAVDLVARYGGEEFCIVMPDTSIDGAVTLIRTIARDEVEVSNGAVVTFSAGLSVWEEGKGAVDLIADADKLLYQAKGSGRNSLCHRQVGMGPDSFVCVPNLSNALGEGMRLRPEGVTPSDGTETKLAGSLPQ